MASGSAPPPPPASNPRSFLVGFRRHSAWVTNRADEAAEWVAAVRRLPRGEVRVIGLSFMWTKRSQAGAGAWRVQSIHFSFLARVLVYVLGQEPLSATVRDFLRDPENLFVAAGLVAALEALRVGHRPEAAPPRVDLFDVARMCGLADVTATADCSWQLYGPLMEVLLRDVDVGILRSTEHQRQPWQWPLSNAQIEFAVHTSVIAQSLGLRALGRRRLPL